MCTSWSRPGPTPLTLHGPAQRAGFGEDGAKRWKEPGSLNNLWNGLSNHFTEGKIYSYNTLEFGLVYLEAVSSSN